MPPLHPSAGVTYTPGRIRYVMPCAAETSQKISPLALLGRNDMFHVTLSDRRESNGADGVSPLALPGRNDMGRD